MSFISIKPSAALTGLVESLWDCDWAPTPHCLERVLPSAYGQLIVNLYEDETREYFEDDGSLRCVRLAGTTLAGPQALSGIIDTREQRQVMGVILHPPGAMAFARQALDQLHGHSVDVAALLGERQSGIRQRLLEAGGPHERLRRLEQWLCQQIGGIRPHPAVEFAISSLKAKPQVSRIADVVRDSGLSPRRFARLFEQNVGMGAKRYARLLRFRHLVDSAHGSASVNWAGLAADCGFHDQAHLVHEFRAFSGMTPGAYLSSQGHYASHVPLP